MLPDAPRLEDFTVPADAAGTRLDTFLARRQSEFSRTFFQQLIRDGGVLVNGRQQRGSLTLEGGEHIRITFPPAESPWPRPQDLPLDILFEDEHLIVVNKAAGMVVHPAAGNPDGTLVNALLHHCPDLPGINGVKRPGIVHRLDRETSGVMVVAKTDRAMSLLCRHIRERLISRVYLALVIGEPDWTDHTVDAPIGRNPAIRIKRSVNGEGARDAVTHLHVLARQHGFTLLRCELETGRTHQIRVHCSSIGLPIAGDDTYGGGPHRVAEKLQRADSKLRGAFHRLTRPFLHARLLRFRHPATGHWAEFAAPLPPDLKAVLAALMPEVEAEGLITVNRDGGKSGHSA
ncbi:RluA family pseudouridine synthase [Candidatus Poribacteria bacterium]|nr:RluA family pseudouridine synthase [Candidatus Poribacteria bacterium]